MDEGPQTGGKMKVVKQLFLLVIATWLDMLQDYVERRQAIEKERRVPFKTEPQQKTRSRVILETWTYVSATEINRHPQHLTARDVYYNN